MSNEDPLSTTAVAQRAASCNATLAFPCKDKEEGQTPKAKGSEALEWSEPMTASLMRLRYETYSSKFLSARNNAMIRIVYQRNWNARRHARDNDTIGDLLDSDSDDGTRTMAEGLEIGMKAMSSGFHAVASAISSQQSADSSSPPQHLESVMEARFATIIDQLQTQNNNLATLVELLRKQ
ncbi:hypothetical protein GQ600_14632 [Phytophthora cactorum]|nr:hypothetical protein GQ600_14632 [Phytophthora cactorum]